MIRFIVSLVGGASLGGIYTLVALGMVLAYRATATFNFAHGHFLLLPAFLVGAWQASGSGPLAVLILVALLANAALGAAFYLIVLQRTTGNHFMGGIATLGLASMLDGVMLLTLGSEQLHIELPGMPTGVTEIAGARVSTSSLAIAGFTLLLSVLVAAALRFTSLGRRIRAAGQDPILASQGGINVRLLHLLSWAAAAVLAGIAGIAYGSIHLIEPSLVHLALAAFPAILIGGLDSIPGSLIGGIVVGVFQGFVATYFDPSLLDVSTYTLLLVVLLVLPSGLMGTRHVRRV